MEQDVRVIEVRLGGRRRIDRVLDPGYVRGLDELPLGDLRERRDEAAQEETDLSYLRRLLHARIDIVRAEQQRRSNGGQRSVVDQLARILSDNALHPARGSGRHQVLEPSRAGEHRRQVEALVGNIDLTDVGSLADEKLAATLSDYVQEEASVSSRRREVQAVVDLFNSEIATRYASGTASVDDLLAAERARDEEAG
jgi:transposase InsO family protein